VVDWSGGVFASCITRVQLYVNACSWMAAVCAAAPLALANELPLPRLYSVLVRSSRKLSYIKNPTFTFTFHSTKHCLLKEFHFTGMDSSYTTASLTCCLTNYGAI